jgi:hypothetical protein
MSLETSPRLRINLQGANSNFLFDYQASLNVWHLQHPGSLVSIPKLSSSAYNIENDDIFLDDKDADEAEDEAMMADSKALHRETPSLPPSSAFTSNWKAAAAAASSKLTGKDRFWGVVNKYAAHAAAHPLLLSSMDASTQKHKHRQDSSRARPLQLHKNSSKGLKGSLSSTIIPGESVDPSAIGEDAEHTPASIEEDNDDNNEEEDEDEEDEEEEDDDGEEGEGGMNEEEVKRDGRDEPDEENASENDNVDDDLDGHKEEDDHVVDGQVVDVNPSSAGTFPQQRKVVGIRSFSASSSAAASIASSGGGGGGGGVISAFEYDMLDDFLDDSDLFAARKQANAAGKRLKARDFGALRPMQVFKTSLMLMDNDVSDNDDDDEKEEGDDDGDEENNEGRKMEALTAHKANIERMQELFTSGIDGEGQEPSAVYSFLRPFISRNLPTEEIIDEVEYLVMNNLDGGIDIGEFGLDEDYFDDHDKGYRWSQQRFGQRNGRESTRGEKWCSGRFIPNGQYKRRRQLYDDDGKGGRRSGGYFKAKSEGISGRQRLVGGKRDRNGGTRSNRYRGRDDYDNDNNEEAGGDRVDKDDDEENDDDDENSMDDSKGAASKDQRRNGTLGRKKDMKKKKIAKKSSDETSGAAGGGGGGATSLSHLEQTKRLLLQILPAFFDKKKKKISSSTLALLKTSETSAGGGRGDNVTGEIEGDEETKAAAAEILKLITPSSQHGGATSNSNLAALGASSVSLTQSNGAAGGGGVVVGDAVISKVTAEKMASLQKKIEHDAAEKAKKAANDLKEESARAEKKSFEEEERRREFIDLNGDKPLVLTSEANAALAEYEEAVRKRNRRAVSNAAINKKLAANAAAAAQAAAAAAQSVPLSLTTIGTNAAATSSTPVTEKRVIADSPTPAAPCCPPPISASWLKSCVSAVNGIPLEAHTYPLELDHLLARADSLVRKCQSKKQKGRPSLRITAATAAATIPVNDNNSTLNSGLAGGAATTASLISLTSAATPSAAIPLPLSPSDDPNEGQRPAPYIARLLQVKGMPGTKDSCTKAIRRSLIFATARERLLRLERALSALKKHFERRFTESPDMAAESNEHAQQLDKKVEEIGLSTMLKAAALPSDTMIKYIFGPFGDPPLLQSQAAATTATIAEEKDEATLSTSAVSIVSPISTAAYSSASIFTPFVSFAARLTENGRFSWDGPSRAALFDCAEAFRHWHDAEDAWRKAYAGHHMRKAFGLSRAQVAPLDSMYTHLCASLLPEIVRVCAETEVSCRLLLKGGGGSSIEKSQGDERILLPTVKGLKVILHEEESKAPLLHERKCASLFGLLASEGYVPEHELSSSSSSSSSSTAGAASLTPKPSSSLKLVLSSPSRKTPVSTLPSAIGEREKSTTTKQNVPYVYSIEEAKKAFEPVTEADFVWERFYPPGGPHWLQQQSQQQQQPSQQQSVSSLRKKDSSSTIKESRKKGSATFVVESDTAYTIPSHALSTSIGGGGGEGISGGEQESSAGGGDDNVLDATSDPPIVALSSSGRPLRSTRKSSIITSGARGSTSRRTKSGSGGSGGGGGGGNGGNRINKDAAEMNVSSDVMMSKDNDMNQTAPSSSTTGGGSGGEEVSELQEEMEEEEVAAVDETRIEGAEITQEKEELEVIN